MILLMTSSTPAVYSSLQNLQQRKGSHVADGAAYFNQQVDRWLRLQWRLHKLTLFLILCLAMSGDHNENKQVGDNTQHLEAGGWKPDGEKQKEKEH